MHSMTPFAALTVFSLSSGVLSTASLGLISGEIAFTLGADSAFETGSGRVGS